MAVDAAETARRVLASRHARRSFRGFIQMRHPDWAVPPFHEELIDVFDRFERDELLDGDGVPYNNVIITMPPRHSKSTYGTIEFPAYYLGRDPRRYVMTTSYSGDLAAGFGRDVRNILREADFAMAFPGARLSQDAQSAASFRMEAGGAYYGIGVGGSTSGKPATLLIIDDAYKNRSEAESATIRNKVWSHYESALLPRLQPTHDGRPPKQIVINTRWHPDDLIGRLLKLDQRWYHVDFPALSEREGGGLQALWPERFPVERLRELRSVNAREFEALYQQRPFVRGGNLLQSDWWRYAPPDLLPRMSTLILSVDSAYKMSEHSDWSVIMLLGMSAHGDMFVLDVQRGRWAYPDLKRRLIQANALHRGKGLRGVFVEDASSGMALVQELRRESGIAVVPQRVAGDKVTRAHMVTPLIEGGRVHLVAGAPWLDEFVSECEQFPHGSADDQVDALVMGLNVLNRITISVTDDLTGGRSLLQEYNATRDMVTDSLNRRVNRRSKDTFKWRGWGM